jgi:hypothetical protein
MDHQLLLPILHLNNDHLRFIPPNFGIFPATLTLAEMVERYRLQLLGLVKPES